MVVSSSTQPIENGLSPEQLKAAINLGDNILNHMPGGKLSPEQKAQNEATKKDLTQTAFGEIVPEFLKLPQKAVQQLVNSLKRIKPSNYFIHLLETIEQKGEELKTKNGFNKQALSAIFPKAEAAFSQLMNNKDAQGIILSALKGTSMHHKFKAAMEQLNALNGDRRDVCKDHHHRQPFQRTTAAGIGPHQTTTKI